MTSSPATGPVSFGASALIMLFAALGRLLWRGLLFAPTLRVARDLGRCDYDYPRYG
jgi:hypothetical protein